ncbi:MULTISPECIES: DUF2637 domain-containing protein [Streptomyces]|uniref:DUF2637 domain-containing protein n=2 Tax=Streptomyces TaxID=1883 RepID=A0A3R7FC52_9ACTN|nr:MULTISPECIES: DUF2637 domain-containing protein [Streptomyces]KNE79655.1 hypothetical protein ADZ36_26460 [Streptomyces fradiae]OFA37730.1 hypothetical protein BEN35_28675 [Streptomyces fradiae]PQM23198.1 DUF2637 domain-containing protein [Streptomyces xinghaiensis]RKM94759.1 DUF2637 domain-containing protein [Streptomyces xinghaiensis]RNC74800.1 DUF2637 domain-containing protein [Streptomyces xinghaiensis]
MSATSAAGGSVPSLSRAEKTLLGTVVPVGVGVGGLGLASSFASVSATGERWGFAWPWMLPVGIDLAIPVFTAANLLLVRLGMPLAWVRFVPWGLTLITCGLNVAAGDSLPAKFAHGTMPLLWVVLSEIAAHVYAVRIGIATGSRMERVRRSRWLFAPRTTLLLWRRMVLWEITDYRAALALEKQRQLARAELRETYGRSWRRKAPRRDLVLLRLGELAPEGVFLPPGEEEADSRPGAEGEPVARPKLFSEPRRRQRRMAAGKGRRMTWDEAIAKAREITADWSYDALDADPIRRAVGCGQDRSRQLRDALRAERRQRSATAEPATAPA